MLFRSCENGNDVAGERILPNITCVSDIVHARTHIRVPAIRGNRAANLGIGNLPDVVVHPPLHHVVQPETLSQRDAELQIELVVEIGIHAQALKF